MRTASVYNLAMAIASVNPATGEILKSFEPHDEEEIERRVALADSAFRSYRRTTYDERARLVGRHGRCDRSGPGCDR